jgi:linoleoyl-CoA desaturase
MTDGAPQGARAPRRPDMTVATAGTAPSDSHASSETTASPPPHDREARLRAFGQKLDALEKRVRAEVGEHDVKRVKRLDALSHAMGGMGRVLLVVSVEPITFTAGVILLWLHKQLQATEVGHTALHGAYDGLPNAERYQSKSFAWHVPIDEASWRYGHNVRHHGSTNVAGKDADIHFGPVRLTEQTPWNREHAHQLLFTSLVLFPNFGFLMNLHFTGLNDAYFDNGRDDQLDFLKDRSRESVREAWRKALRKYVPYYAREYVMWPAIGALVGGPLNAAKVLFGTWLAETMRDVYSAATIFCGHVASYPAGTQTRSKGDWDAHQVEASQNFEVPLPVSVLCGGLDRQIEHHLFPRLSPERLRQIAPEVKALCAEHGVAYHTDTWPNVLRKAFSWIGVLSRDHGAVGGARAALAAMA